MDVIIVGATGYSGLELIRILIQHPLVDDIHLYAHTAAHESVLEVYPHLQERLNIPIHKLPELDNQSMIKLKQKSNIVFFATPSAISKEWGQLFLQYGFRVIDLSGDYRLKDPSLYPIWYNFDHPNQSILNQATYGLSEWFAEDIKHSNYIANPGCYATSILLGLAPLLKAGVISDTIIIDAKSGVSGAGKKLIPQTHFAEVNENFKPYKVGNHQHIPEIEQTIGMLGQKKINIQLMTHLVPMTRGILSTIYVDIEEDSEYQGIADIYEKHYRDKPFIRVKPENTYPETKQVFGTNYCDIGFYVDKRTNKLVIFSAIDNLMKGAAGQAVQNLNLMMGWEEQMGLHFIPTYP